MKKNFESKVTLLAASIFLLWMNFSGHTLSTLSFDKFLEGEFESERFAISRLVYSLNHGLESQGGFMLRYSAAEGLRKSVNREDYATFKKEKSNHNIEIYYSHTGIQDDLLWPLWLGLKQIKTSMLKLYKPGTRWHERMQTLDLYYFILITQWFVAFLNALVISLFIFWSAREINNRVGWMTLLSVLIFMPVLTYFGRSIWWMEWSWYLPFLIILGWMHCRPAYGWLDALLSGALAGLAVGLKTAMGYEFVPTIMISVLIPPAFYAFKYHWSLRQWAGFSLIIGILALCGFIAAFIEHWKALENFNIDPRDFIQSHFAMRAYGGYGALQGEMADSVKASAGLVILGYLFLPKELMIPEIIFLAPFLWMLWTRRKTIMSDRIFAGFTAAITLGFIGALSMFVILKGHAYIHGFDVVAWSIPLNLLLCVLYARHVDSALRMPEGTMQTAE